MDPCPFIKRERLVSGRMDELIRSSRIRTRFVITHETGTGIHVAGFCFCGTQVGVQIGFTLQRSFCGRSAAVTWRYLRVGFAKLVLSVPSTSYSIYNSV